MPGQRSPFFVQRRVGAAATCAALLIALANAALGWLNGAARAPRVLHDPTVWVPLVFGVVLLASSLREGRAYRIIQIAVFFAAALFERFMSPPGEITGMIIYVFGIVLGIQYDLVKIRDWPLIVVLLGVYTAAEVLASVSVFRDSPARTIPILIATALAFYLFWFVFAQEIQERRRSEALLRESEERFGIAVRNSEIMIANQDLDLRYTWYYNPHPWLAGMDLGGTCDDELYPAEDAERLSRLKRTVIDQGVGIKREFHTRIDGKEHYLDLTIDPLYDSERRIIGITIASKEVTERVVMHNQLVQSERYIAAGQLATYIAHEINSPLQGITSLLGVIKNLYPDDEELTTNLQLVAGAFSSIRDTVRKLLNLNRPFAEQREIIDVNTVVASTFSLTDGLLREQHVRASLALAPGKLEVHGYAQQIMQVFINLINNALEAMNRAGEPQRSDAPDDAPQATPVRTISVSTAREARHVVVRFLDSGPGFTPEEQAHLFDPFFTRKSRIGMGLGLAITLRVIEELGGSITAENAEVGGALFTIRIPLVAAQQHALPHDGGAGETQRA